MSSLIKAAVILIQTENLKMSSVISSQPHHLLPTLSSLQKHFPQLVYSCSDPCNIV